MDLSGDEMDLCRDEALRFADGMLTNGHGLVLFDHEAQRSR